MSMPASSTGSSMGGRARVSLSPRNIPALPGALADLLRIANDPSVTVAELEKTISRDQALTLRMLAVANSSFYGCSRRIDSVRTALALLGTQQVQNVASAMALAPVFACEHGPALWAHGLSTALWTRYVMRTLGVPAIEYLFTTALMHDIGIVLLLKNAPDEEAACMRVAAEHEHPLHEVEADQLGIDHAQLGARAARAWRLPERIAELVALHHELPDGTHVDHAVLAVADALAAVTGTGELCGPVSKAVAPELLVAAGLRNEDLAVLLGRADAVAAEACAFG
jgi:putative nucleotidyltransferase with HDIG domain